MVAKLKYLVMLFFYERTCKIDFSHSTRKFYGNFNNIMSVVGFNISELVAVHLVKTYCVPSLLHGCEEWYDYHNLNHLVAGGVKVCHVCYTIVKHYLCHF